VLTLILTRHGHTDLSDPDRYLGQHLDARLSIRGRADAERLRDRLAGVTFDRVIASPLRRASDTAALVAPGAIVETDRRLMEADYGDWEGLPARAVAARWPELRSAWQEDPARIRPPQGENGLLLARRARSFLRELTAVELARAERDGERRILVVGHSTINRVLLAVALGVPVRDYRRRFQQDWLNLTVLRPEASGHALLVVANDTAHLREPGAIPWP
jgi:broad specificity phosphatase PhoE